MQSKAIKTDFPWSPSSDTIAYWALNWNTIDWSWNWHNWTISWNVWYTAQWSRNVAIINWTPSWIATWWSFMDQIGTWDFTISAWMNISWSVNMDDSVMFAFWKEEDPRPWFSLRLQKNNYIEFWVWEWNSSWLTVSNPSQYYWWWHNFILTRKNWVVYCYIDKILKWSFNYSSAITWIDNWWILSRKNDRQYMKLWTKWAEYIVEKVWWDLAKITKYFNKSKQQFWLSKKHSTWVLFN